MSKPKTAEQARAEFLDSIRVGAEYWSSRQGTRKEICEGLVFSILVLLDGGTLPLPGIDLVLRPHPSDEAYYQSQNEDWYEDGMVINDCQMHELFNEPGLPPEREPLLHLTDILGSRATPEYGERSSVRSGITTINEVRRREEFPPIAWGDDPAPEQEREKLFGDLRKFVKGLWFPPNEGVSDEFMAEIAELKDRIQAMETKCD